MSKSEKIIKINLCSFDELRDLPSVGPATAYKIWELRKAGKITQEKLATISHIQMEKVLPRVDFTTSAEHANSFIGSDEEDEDDENTKK